MIETIKECRLRACQSLETIKCTRTLVTLRDGHNADKAKQTILDVIHDAGVIALWTRRLFESLDGELTDVIRLSAVGYGLPESEFRIGRGTAHHVAANTSVEWLNDLRSWLESFCQFTDDNAADHHQQAFWLHVHELLDKRDATGDWQKILKELKKRIAEFDADHDDRLLRDVGNESSAAELFVRDGRYEAKQDGNFLKRKILDTLEELNAKSEATRVKTERVAELMKEDPNNLKATVSKLVLEKKVDSKTGRGGGIWKR